MHADKFMLRSSTQLQVSQICTMSVLAWLFLFCSVLSIPDFLSLFSTACKAVGCNTNAGVQQTSADSVTVRVKAT